MDYYDIFIRAYAVANKAWEFRFFPHFLENPITSQIMNYYFMENLRESTMLEF